MYQRPNRKLINIFHNSIVSGDIERVKSLLRVYYFDLNARRGGLGYLHGLRDEKMANLLVRCGANVNLKTYQGDTPLHVAARYDYEAVAFLIKLGADVSAKNKRGLTPFDSAMHAGSISAANLISEAGG